MLYPFSPFSADLHHAYLCRQVALPQQPADQGRGHVAAADESNVHSDLMCAQASENWDDIPTLDLMNWIMRCIWMMDVIEAFRTGEEAIFIWRPKFAVRATRALRVRRSWRSSFS
jgi:hypothetical protein